MPIRDIRIYEDGKIIIHHAISNNLTIYNIDLTVFKEFLGVKEKYNSRIELPQLRRKKQSASDALETIEDSYGTRVVAISPSLINLLVKSSTMKAFGSKKIKKDQLKVCSESQIWIAPRFLPRVLKGRSKC